MKKISKDFDAKLLALWEQCINSKKQDIAICKKTKNKERIEVNLVSLKAMEKQYEQVKNQITKTS